MTTTPAPADPMTVPAAPAANQAETNKTKVKGKYKRPPIALPEPQDADALMNLRPWELDRLVFETTMRHGRAKQRRAQLIQADTTNGMAIQSVNGEIAWLGCLLSVLLERRAFLRVKARRKLGRGPTRDEAVAVAVDRLVTGPLYRRLQREADKIEARAAKDLADHDQQEAA